jgi:tripartite-type tricarboxylate transporter receptor subunit TctC
MSVIKKCLFRPLFHSTLARRQIPMAQYVYTKSRSSRSFPETHHSQENFPLHFSRRQDRRAGHERLVHIKNGLNIRRVVRRNPARAPDFHQWRRLSATARALLTAAMAVLLVMSFPGMAPGQNFPLRPIRIIVPSAPGGAGDLLARELGGTMESVMRTPVVIDNRVGASGVIGNDLVARAPPDGYTLLFGTSATQIISAFAIRKLPYDPTRDFVPVINAAYATSVIVVNANLPVTTLSELIAYARSNPRLLNYASSGVGSANHMDTEVFMALAGISLQHVPYRGTADGFRALLADEVQVMFAAVTSALPYVRSQKLRALAVLTDRRSPLLPDVPTIAQAGLGRVDVRKWLGFFAPAGTPPGVIVKLNRAFNEILHEREVAAWLQDNGFERAGGTSRAFGQLLEADVAKWDQTAKRVGLKAE